MSAAGNEDTSALESALPDSTKRDTLGHVCFYHHIAMMVYILGGWIVPWHPALIFYLVFVPSVIGQWRLNKNTCVLNNIESLLRTGKWRNPEEPRGRRLAAHDDHRQPTGIAITKFQLDIIMYSVMAQLVWASRSAISHGLAVLGLES